MAVFKCKMCGANLESGENRSVATCEYCGTQQTLPKIDDEKKVALFNRANNLRIKCEFDKAAGIYESITAEFPEEAEAFWGLVLCKYGIEYVDDKDGRKIPTCHRTLPTSIMKDEDFQQACENADISAKAIYREEAKAIDGIQKKILEIAATEEPYDIFICYKETDDATGARTEDSSIAQDIYTALTEKGYKVFYARNTLKKVAGTEYEPYIYAALSSAKIMLAIGTKFDYYDAVWVKNEWSRFISMMADDSSKILIPCYKNMDAYDIPDEFSNMQALDMNDVTFFNNLEASMERILPKGKAAVKESVIVNNGTDVAPLLKRAFMFLEDGDFARADDFCEQVLNIDPENAEAYLGKLMAGLRICKSEQLKELAKPFDSNINFQKCIKYGDSKLKSELEGYIYYINMRNENVRLEGIYAGAIRLMNIGTEDSLNGAAVQFKTISNYKDAASLVEVCMKRAEEVRKLNIYSRARAAMTSSSFEYAINLFKLISDYKDSNMLLEQCVELEKAEQIEREREEKAARELSAAKAKRMKILVAVASSVVAVVVVVTIVLNTVIIPANKYNDAIALMDAGENWEAIEIFGELDDYKDSQAYYSSILEKIAVKTTIDAGTFYSVGLNSDGTVVAVGDNEDGQCDVSELTDIVAVSAGASHTVALKSDGTVVAVGDKGYGKCDVSSWTDIVAISAGYSHTVGLKSDGTVVAIGSNAEGQCDVSGWTDIVAISAGANHTVGLKSDGTVVATEIEEDYYDDGQCDVEDWTDIVAISAGNDHTVGLKSDGTVVATEYNGEFYNNQCDVSGWTDIVAISAGMSHTVGLKSDGTVVAVGIDEYYSGVEDWTNVVSISAGNYHIVGLKSDGTVVAVGLDTRGQCDVGSWNNIKQPLNY